MSRRSQRTIKSYPELVPAVAQILAEELGEVVDEFPYSRNPIYFTGKVKLRVPLKVVRSSSASGLMCCNESTGALLNNPIWLSAEVYSAIERLHPWKPAFRLPTDGESEIYLWIKLQQDEDLFWRADYPDFERDATPENLLKEVRILAQRLAKGIAYSDRESDYTP